MLLLAWVLGLWGGRAWAGLTEPEVAAEVQRVQADLGGRLLLAAVGPEAEKLAERVLRANLTLQADAQVVRLPTAGDPTRELWLALNNAGLRCALRLAEDTEGEGGWLLMPFGNCVAQVAHSAVATAAILPTEDAAARFVEGRLSLAEPLPRTSVAWDVQDGAGTRLSAPNFSSLVRDTATTEALLREQRAALRGRTALRITGGLLVASAIVPLANNPGLTTAVGEDRAWTALFLASTGTLAYFVAPRAVDAVNERQKRAANYYTEKQAQEWIDAHNLKLQQELGLAPLPSSSSTAPSPAPSEPSASGDERGGTR